MSLMARANKCRYQARKRGHDPCRAGARLAVSGAVLLSPILTLDPQKVDRDLAFVMDCLSEVLEESREHALARQLPWSRKTGRVERQVKRNRPANLNGVASAAPGCDFA